MNTERELHEAVDALREEVIALRKFSVTIFQLLDQVVTPTAQELLQHAGELAAKETRTNDAIRRLTGSAPQ